MPGALTIIGDRTKAGRGDSGRAVLEFALVVPVLLFVIVAIIQFAVLYSNYVTLTDATRVGARVAAVSRTTCPGNTVQAVRDSASTLNQADLNVTVTACPWTPGGQVKVTATYPYKIDLLGFIPVASGSLTSSTTERVE
jgi:Flp pilus assembly protein TadG